jgi:hypothetical protein
MEGASPDLEKNAFSAVVFISREYSGQQDTAPKKNQINHQSSIKKRKI